MASSSNRSNRSGLVRSVLSFLGVGGNGDEGIPIGDEDLSRLGNRLGNAENAAEDQRYDVSVLGRNLERIQRELSSISGDKKSAPETNERRAFKVNVTRLLAFLEKQRTFQPDDFRPMSSYSASATREAIGAYNYPEHFFFSDSENAIPLMGIHIVVHSDRYANNENYSMSRQVQNINGNSGYMKLFKGDNGCLYPSVWGAKGKSISYDASTQDAEITSDSEYFARSMYGPSIRSMFGDVDFARKTNSFTINIQPTMYPTFPSFLDPSNQSTEQDIERSRAYMNGFIQLLKLFSNGDSPITPYDYTLIDETASSATTSTNERTSVGFITDPNAFMSQKGKVKALVNHYSFIKAVYHFMQNEFAKIDSIVTRNLSDDLSDNYFVEVIGFVSAEEWLSNPTEQGIEDSRTRSWNAWIESRAVQLNYTNTENILESSQQSSRSSGRLSSGGRSLTSSLRNPTYNVGEVTGIYIPQEQSSSPSIGPNSFLGPVNDESEAQFGSFIPTTVRLSDINFVDSNFESAEEIARKSALTSLANSENRTRLVTMAKYKYDKVARFADWTMTTSVLNWTDYGFFLGQKSIRLENSGEGRGQVNDPFMHQIVLKLSEKGSTGAPMSIFRMIIVFEAVCSQINNLNNLLVYLKPSLNVLYRKLANRRQPIRSISVVYGGRTAGRVEYTYRDVSKWINVDAASGYDDVSWQDLRRRVKTLLSELGTVKEWLTEVLKEQSTNTRSRITYADLDISADINCIAEVGQENSILLRREIMLYHEITRANMLIGGRKSLSIESVRTGQSSSDLRVQQKDLETYPFYAERHERKFLSLTFTRNNAGNPSVIGPPSQVVGSRYSESTDAKIIPLVINPAFTSLFDFIYNLIQPSGTDGRRSLRIQSLESEGLNAYYGNAFLNQIFYNVLPHNVVFSLRGVVDNYMSYRSAIARESSRTDSLLTLSPDGSVVAKDYATIDSLFNLATERSSNTRNGYSFSLGSYLSMLLSVIRAIRYMTSVTYSHRAISPENIVVDEFGQASVRNVRFSLPYNVIEANDQVSNENPLTENPNTSWIDLIAFKALISRGILPDRFIDDYVNNPTKARYLGCVVDSSFITFLLRSPNYGESFVRTLLADPTVTVIASKKPVTSGIPASQRILSLETAETISIGLNQIANAINVDATTVKSEINQLSLLIESALRTMVALVESNTLTL